MPKSIYERLTKPTVPPPELRDRTHVVLGSESLMSVANREYGLEEYDPDAWRLVGEANDVRNPFTFGADFLGRSIRVPARPLPDFE